MARFTGGCLCGRIRYTASGDPAFTGVCHCRDCQRFSGTAFSTVLGFPSGALVIEGEPKQYRKSGDSGNPVTRVFCPECGSGVTEEVGAMPGMTLVLAGTLDDPAGVQPTIELFCDSAQPWVSLGGDRQRFPAMPG